MTGDGDLRALFTRLAAARTRDPEPPARTPAQDKIIRAALDVFAAEGYTAATTRAIATRAGVAEKTIFQAFGSKANLFNEAVYPLLVDTIGPRVFESLRSVIERAPGNLAARVRAIAAERLALAAAEPQLFKFLLQELLLRPGFRAPFVAHWQARIFPPIRAVIAGAIDRGEVRTIAPGRVLRMLISLVVGYIVTRHILAPDLPWDDAAELDAMLDVLFHGLRVPPSNAYEVLDS